MCLFESVAVRRIFPSVTYQTDNKKRKRPTSSRRITHVSFQKIVFKGVHIAICKLLTCKLQILAMSLQNINTR